MQASYARSIDRLALTALAAGALLAGAPLGARAAEKPASSDVRALAPLPTHAVRFQGLRRIVRFHVPERLDERPALVLVLHGSGGDGERFRRFTAGAFDRAADRHGFLVAYPDALGGQWHDCRTGAPYHRSLAGVDDVGFLRAVAKHAQAVAGRAPRGVFAAGYSNGGHLVFRLALEAPDEYSALAAVGAHLPVPRELGCAGAGTPVSMLLVSGTADPINPWAGGEVAVPGGGSPGHVLSAGATARYFRDLAGLDGEGQATLHADLVPGDEVRVVTRRWAAPGRREVALLVLEEGGHVLPHPDASFPAAVVGPASRDLDGAEAIWGFFSRHLPPVPPAPGGDAARAVSAVTLSPAHDE